MLPRPATVPRLPGSPSEVGSARLRAGTAEWSSVTRVTTAEPAQFRAAVAAMNATTVRPEIELGPIRPPKQLEEWMVKYPAGEQLNYVIDTGDGRRIYMAGSFPDPSLIEIARSTQAYMTLLQVIPGRTLQGMEEQVVEFGLASGAEIIVPQHHDPLMEGANPTDLSKLRSLFATHEVEFQEFIPGRWYAYP